MKIDHDEIIDTSFYSITSRMTSLIKETLHLQREILHTSITADKFRFYGTIIWKEND